MKQGEKTKKLILDVSSELFYHKGYSSTSFGDIVEKTGLSKGNITYHFKNKEEILKGIVQNRLEGIQSSIQEWKKTSDDSKERLKMFCEMIVDEQENLEKYGCPLGTLTSEFSKHEPQLYAITLPLFQTFREWIAKEYVSLGSGKEEADEKAMSLLSKVQGVALITHVFKDKEFLVREIDSIKKEL
ncbi:TetR/AcrR family transcriptional regulator [Sulfurimonas sp.]|uniref:TetR/AcrR family transcriptional regulator n=1 Tax=Sulfurimonas sp. TaxID=2022749 RepID=UPI003D0B735F